MELSNHEALFEKTSRLTERGLPIVHVQELNDFTINLLQTFQRKSETRTNYVIHNGRKLADVCPQVLRELKNIGIQTQEPTFHWNEVTRLFSSFFRFANDHPCMMWSHSVCWTDRAILRQFYGSDLKRYLRPRLVRISPGTMAKLYFEAKRRVSVRCREINWLLSDQFTSSYEFVKVVESQASMVNRNVTSVGHRETLGVSGDILYDRKWLSRSLFPSFKEHAYSLISDPRDNTPRLLHEETNGITPDNNRKHLVVPRGILDLQIIKAWRLSTPGVLPGKKAPMADELSLAFRPTGEVAYIAATWDRLERHLPNKGYVEWFDSWMNH